MVTMWSLLTMQRGLMSSIASRVRLQPSHWSPRASLNENNVSIIEIRYVINILHIHNEGKSLQHNDPLEIYGNWSVGK